MLTDLSLTGFKAFKEFEKPMRISPLTILCGRNSSGKSSILQSLLLLKQSYKADPENEALILNGPFVQCASFRDLCYDLPSESRARFSLTLGFSRQEQRSVLCFEFMCKGSAPEDHPATVVNKLTWLDPEKGESSIRYINHQHSWKRDLGSKAPSPPAGFSYQWPGRLIYQNFMPQLVNVRLIERAAQEQDAENRVIFGEFPVEFVSRSLGNSLQQLRSELKNLRYLGPIRAKPLPIYSSLDSPYKELDTVGSNAAQVFYMQRENTVSFAGEDMTLAEAMNRATQMVGFKQQIHPEQVGPSVYQIRVGLRGRSKKEVTIADVGFGFSQFLPIVLGCLLAPQRSIVMLEQPEIHLHPSSRGNLLDVLLACMSDTKRLIVETHSTELINKLRLRVIENPELADKINIVFIEEGRDGADLRQLELNSQGMLDEWPDGFCDESSKLARQIIDARIHQS